MLLDYQKAKIKDLYGKETGIELEVNWNPGDENTNECKIIKLTYGNKDFYIKKEEFFAFLWLIGSSTEHMKMVPQKIRRTKWYETVISVKALKDVKKGDNLTFPIKLTLPTTEEEVIADIKRSKTDNKIIIP